MGNTAGTLVFAVLWFGSWFAALRHLFSHSEREFTAAHASKSAWTVALLVAGPFAAVPYWLTARKRLDEVSAV